MSKDFELATALRDRLQIIGDEESRRQPDEHLNRLRQVSQRIDRLAAELPAPVPAQLAHYLQKRSYDKALAFLEGTE